MAGAWTLEDALNFVQELAVVIEPVGYYPGLTGSVVFARKGRVYKGRSSSDIDVILYPASTAAFNMKDLKAALKSFGLVLVVPRARVKAKWRRLGSQDNKHVEVWDYYGRKVDFFFWPESEVRDDER